MLPLLGLTWIPGFLLLDNSKFSVVMTYVFCVLNTLQGCAFFVFHCALNRSVRRLMFQKVESTQFFNRWMPIRLRRSSAVDERGSSSTVTSDSRVIATIFGKRGSLSFNTADVASWDLMAGKFTSTVALHRHPHCTPPSTD
ncbi:adhesion G protein-coupled receptor L2-like [Ixodes scapularis]|uniref:adhesion G protein-coupled receptor L2-like n=1 Tax=Ixodes scapularis TaxID=6945 RepID=UPI001A9F45AD|nr:adhesion G protein-coupled receptor L2-like [Ixodes scapularis]